MRFLQQQNTGFYKSMNHYLDLGQKEMVHDPSMVPLHVFLAKIHLLLLNLGTTA